MAKARERWCGFSEPASFSSAEYVAKALKQPKHRVREALQKSVLYQAHRDLREKFARRSNFASVVNERWEADLADLGGKIPAAISGEIKRGKRNQLLMLVVVDVFSGAIYAQAVSSKGGETVAKAMATIISEAGAAPFTLTTDKGRIRVKRTLS